MVASFALLPVMWMLSLIPAPWMFPLIAFIMADKEIREVFRLEGAKLNKCLFGTARVQIIFTLIQLFAMYNADRVREVVTMVLRLPINQRLYNDDVQLGTRQVSTLM